MQNKINSKELEEFKKRLEAENRKKEVAIKKVPDKETPEQKPEYMKPTPYWKLEKPLKLEYGNLEIYYYEKSGALQIKIIGFDDKTGKEYPEQKISLRKHILFDQPRMLFFLADTLKKWRKEYDEYEKE